MTSATARRSTYWTRLGTDITGAATVPDALAAAGLDWGLRTIADPSNVTILTEEGVTTTWIPDRTMILRADTNVTLGVVGNRYQHASNAQVFAPLEVLRESGARFCSAGETNHGRAVFMLMDLPDAHVQVGGQDLIEFHLLVRAAHDGAAQISYETRASRLVCTNGMTVSLKGVPNKIMVRHTGNVAEAIEQARDGLRAARRYATEFAAAAEHLISSPMTVGEFVAFIDRMWPRPAEPTTPAAKRSFSRWERRRSELMELYRFAGTNDLGRDTAWAAFNAVTEHVDWYGATRGGDPTERRALRQLDQSGQDTKDRAAEQLLALAR